MPSTSQTFMSVLSRKVVPLAPAPTYHLNFDGVNDQIVIPASSSLNNLPLGDFTVEFSMGNLGTSGEGPLLYKVDSSYLGWDIAFYSASNTLAFFITYDGYANWVDVEYVLEDLETVRHFEFSWKASTKTPRLFISGVEASLLDYTSGTLGVYDSDSGNDISIGKFMSAAAQLHLNYLVISKIQKHTSTFIPPSLTVCPAPDANTVLRLALDEGSGAIAGDTSGHGDDGVISGATWEAD